MIGSRLEKPETEGLTAGTEHDHVPQAARDRGRFDVEEILIRQMTPGRGLVEALRRVCEGAHAIYGYTWNCRWAGRECVARPVGAFQGLTSSGRRARMAS